MMKIDKTEWIGKVSVKHVRRDSQSTAVYSDGPIESELYRRFRDNPDLEPPSDEYRFKSWAEEYHLSPIRHNLLKWYPFYSDGCALEVGAGCGALTGLLCDRLKEVVALEYSSSRALVTAQRNSNRSNLEVIVGGLQDFECERQFDYIAVIGVLEYAGAFYVGKDPYGAFLTKLRSMLKPNGRLILAIENKIGLKYIAGAPEDHGGRVFDSIYNYPSQCEARTFCKKELKHLLEAAGFIGMRWYYPLPDYKMPQVVLSDEITISDLDSLWSLFPTRRRGHVSREVLSERRFGKTVADAGLFGELANSFLVVAGSEDIVDDFRCLRFNGADRNRKPELRTNVRVCMNGKDKIVIKSADDHRSLGFIEKIRAAETMAQENLPGIPVIGQEWDEASLYYPYIEAPFFKDLMGSAIRNQNPDCGKPLLEDYMRFLHTMPIKNCIPKEFMDAFQISAKEFTKPVPCLPFAPLDCTPRNIAIDEHQWYVIDHEWSYEFPVPVDFVAYRGIMALVVDLQSLIQTRVSREHPVVLVSGYGKNRRYMPLSWLDLIRDLEFPADQLNRWEMLFQNRALVVQKWHRRLRLRRKPRPVSEIEVTEMVLESLWLYCIRFFLARSKRLVLRFRQLTRFFQFWTRSRVLSSRHGASP